MRINPKQFMLSTVLAVMPTILLGIGFIGGRYAVISKFKTQIQGYSTGVFLANLLDEEGQSQVSHAYHDASDVSSRFDEIIWSVPNVPAPFVGTAPTPGQHGNACNNSMQFRSTAEIEMPKPDRIFRIFLIGGSVAYGSGAPSQDRTIAGYLTSMLKSELAPSTGLQYEVFTMANPAWASTHERIIVENRLSELSPDVVISLSGNNDVHWGKRGRNVLWFWTYSDQLFLNLIDTAYEITGNRLQLSDVVQVGSNEIPPRVVAQRLMKNIKLAVCALSGERADYVFVLQPTLAVTGKPLTGRERDMLKDQQYFQGCYAHIDSLFAQWTAVHFRYVNLAHAFDHVAGQEDIFVDSYHFGDKGNEIIARNIFLVLKDGVVQ